MERFRFGVGDYKYFANPLPEIVTELRTRTYPRLAEVANRWAEMLVRSAAISPEHAAFLNICHKAGQTKPTPLVLHYEAGGFNCLHQDLYGEVSFPLQMVLLLGSRPRLGRWRVYPGRTAAPGAVQASGGNSGLRASNYFHDALSAGERHARLLPR